MIPFIIFLSFALVGTIILAVFLRVYLKRADKRCDIFFKSYNTLHALYNSRAYDIRYPNEKHLVSFYQEGNYYKGLEVWVSSMLLNMNNDLIRKENEIKRLKEELKSVAKEWSKETKANLPL
jgi:hypothetical protein